MNTIEKSLELLGFCETQEKVPASGHLLLCWHKLYGLTVGYYSEGTFIFPFFKNEGYSWASHWKYHA